MPAGVQRPGGFRALVVADGPSGKLLTQSPAAPTRLERVRKGLSVIDTNSPQNKPRKSSETARETRRGPSPLTSSDHAGGSADYPHNAASECDDDDEVFFGTIGTSERKKAAGLRGSRRRTVLIPSVANGAGAELRKRPVYAATVIQAAFRGFVLRIAFVEKREAAVVLQRAWRAHIRRIHDQQRCATAALVIQKWWRALASQPTIADQPFALPPVVAPTKAMDPDRLAAIEVKRQQLLLLRQKRKQLENRLRTSSAQSASLSSQGCVENETHTVNTQPAPLIRRDASFNLLEESRWKEDGALPALPVPNAALPPSRLPRRQAFSGVGGFSAMWSSAPVDLERDALKELDRVTRLNTARNSLLGKVDPYTLASGPPVIEANLTPISTALRWHDQLTTDQPSELSPVTEVKSILKKSASCVEEVTDKL